MKDINNLIKQAVQSAESSRHSMSDQKRERKLYRVNGRLLTSVELLWERMTEAYGDLWSRKFGEVPNQTWETMLAEVSDENIARGISKLAKEPKFRDWPPNSVMMFVSLCFPEPEELGLPSDEKAFQQAVGNNTEKSDAVIYTLRNMGDMAFELRRAKREAAEKLFAEYWHQTKTLVMNGGRVPEADREIEQKHVKASKEVGRKHLDALIDTDWSVK